MHEAPTVDVLQGEARLNQQVDKRLAGHPWGRTRDVWPSKMFEHQIATTRFWVNSEIY